MFNLKKYNSTAFETSQVPGLAEEAVEVATDRALSVHNNEEGVPPSSQQTNVSDLMNNRDVDGRANLQAAVDQMALTALEEMAQNQKYDPAILQSIKDTGQWRQIEQLTRNMPSVDLLRSKSPADINAVQFSPEMQEFQAQMRRMLDRQHDILSRQRQQGPALMASVTAQVQSQRFPVSGLGDFIDKFFDDLTVWNGQGGQEDALSNAAITEIQQFVGQGFDQEVNSALETVQQLDGERDAEEIGCILARIYSKWLSPASKLQDPQRMEQSIMSETSPKGIIKFNLDDHVLNNKEGMEKTAASNAAIGGGSYLLYGPTEKRICPKLRGRGVGDVVSEYICRYHCLDGIVIDDAKTICGEAIWRGNIMEKQTREYVDKEGNITGGLIEKRFEVDHTTTPEENKMRLKPGETRKPRPPKWNSLESRMQAMRAEEGKKRGYRPQTDTSKPFNWTRDVDQNNVEVPQAERDRREKASGHEIVEYKNRDEAENNPKVSKTAFNMKTHKQSDLPAMNNKLDESAAALREQSAKEEAAQHQVVQQQKALEKAKHRPDRTSFNMKQHITDATKEATEVPVCPCESETENSELKKKEISIASIPIPMPIPGVKPTSPPLQKVAPDGGIIRKFRRTPDEEMAHQLEVEQTAKDLAMD